MDKESKLSFEQRLMLRRAVSRATKRLAEAIEFTNSETVVNNMLDAELHVQNKRRELSEALYLAETAAIELLNRNIKI